MEQKFYKKYMGSIIFMLALIALTAYFILKDNQLPALALVFGQVNPWYLALGIVVMACSLLCEGKCYYVVFKSFGQKVSFLNNFLYAIIGFYFCAITPSSSGGQPAQMYYMKKDGINLSFATLAVMIITVVNQFVMLLIAAVMFLVESSFIESNLSQMYIVLIYSTIANVLIMGGIVFCIFSKKLVRRFIPWLGKVLVKVHIVKDAQSFSNKALHQIDEYIEGAEYIKKNPAILFKVMFWTILQLSLMYLVTFCVYKAFALNQYSILQVFSIQAILFLAVSALPLPGAVGAAESGFVVMFNTLFGQALVVPAMLLSRGINFYLFLVISGIVTVVKDFILRHRAINKVKQPEQV